jgi:magnesium-transporting ATPase (P-type)
VKYVHATGLLSLIDPPRPEVPKAIATCASSGIQVVMVTGDYPTTAQAIARKIGLMTFPTKSEIAMQRGVNESEVNESEVRAVTIHGAALDSLSDSDWKQLVRKVLVL